MLGTVVVYYQFSMVHTAYQDSLQLFISHFLSWYCLKIGSMGWYSTICTPILDGIKRYGAVFYLIWTSVTHIPNWTTVLVWSVWSVWQTLSWTFLFYVQSLFMSYLVLLHLPRIKMVGQGCLGAVLWSQDFWLHLGNVPPFPLMPYFVIHMLLSRR